MEIYVLTATAFGVGVVATILVLIIMRMRMVVIVAATRPIGFVRMVMAVGVIAEQYLTAIPCLPRAIRHGGGC